MLLILMVLSDGDNACHDNDENNWDCPSLVAAGDVENDSYEW